VKLTVNIGKADAIVVDKNQLADTERTSPSTANEPTPPTPNTATFFAASLASAAGPTSSSIREKRAT
jgi:hypothetical protein